MQESSASPVSPKAEYKSDNMRGCKQVDGMRSQKDGQEDDEWVLETKYVGGLDDEEGVDMEESGADDDYKLFGPDDEGEEEEDFFQGVNPDESDGECDPDREQVYGDGGAGEIPDIPDEFEKVSERGAVVRGRPAARERGERVRGPRRFARRDRRRVIKQF